MPIANFRFGKQSWEAQWTAGAPVDESAIGNWQLEMNR
jgi:hypothetical protein